MSQVRFCFDGQLRFGALAAGLLVAATVAAACQSTPGSSTPAVTVTAETWAVVDNREITRADVDKAYQRRRDTTQTPSEEEVLTAKLNLLNELIGEDILLAKAGELKLEVPPADLETAYTNARKNISEEAFNQELGLRGLTTTDMRENLRRDLLTQKVIAQEVASKVTVTDQEVSDFFTANRNQFNIPEESYRLAQLVVTPVREQQITNASGDDATNQQEATQKVQMLLERLKAGAAFSDLAAGYSEDPESAPRGGDLGLVPVSRLRQAPPQLRDAVLNKEPGTVNVASQGGAHTLVLVIAHEQAGQRDLATPAVKDGITQALRGRKEQLLRAAYLTKIRDDAKVVNYLAQRLVDAKGGPPSLVPASPGAAAPAK